MDWTIENKYSGDGYRIICGTDEAGRGPLCGPVVAGACILPTGIQIPRLNDSKKLTEKRREELFDLITASAVSWAVAESSPEEIDSLNILNASQLAMRRAVAMLTGAKRRIELYGIGSSAMLAEDAAFRFIKLGLPAVVIRDSYISSASALMLDPDCLALAISYTGRTHDIIKTMSIAKEKGAKTMCITCYSDSPLAKLCDLPLIAVSGEAVASKLATVSRLAQMLIVDTLCACIASQRRDDALERQSEIVDAWGEYWLGNQG